MNPTQTLSTRYAWYKQAAQHHPQGGQKQAPDVCISTRFYITQNFPLYICIHLSCPVKPFQYKPGNVPYRRIHAIHLELLENGDIRTQHLFTKTSLKLGCLATVPDFICLYQFENQVNHLEIYLRTGSISCCSDALWRLQTCF